MKEQKTKKVIKKIKRIGVVKLKPKIVGDRKKDQSLIADHIAQATGKAKQPEPNLIMKAYRFIEKKWNKFMENMFGM